MSTQNTSAQQQLIDDLRKDNAELKRIIEENEFLFADRAYLASIVEFSNDAIISVDMQGRIASWNRAAWSMFGYERAHIIGQNAAILYPSGRPHEEGAILDRVMKGEIALQHETVRLSRDGQERQVALWASPIFNAAGEIIGVSQFIRDISAQKKAQEDLRTLQAELIHLSRLNTMGMMAASLAHELNQPLTAMINYVRAARRVLGDIPAAEKAIQFLNKAADETKLAGGIIYSLREFIQKRETTRRSEDINSVLEDGMSLSLSINTAAKAKIQRKMHDDLPPVSIDRVQIQQVLINLVRNAFEAMRDHPSGKVGITTASSEAGWVLVTVSDNGPGLAPEVMQKLFQPFQTTKEKGMGVGLSICQMIVEAHGGRIWAEPNTPRGAIFRFSLPVAKAP